MVEKSWTSGADALIFDLEDSVPDDAKGNAREFVRMTLQTARGKHPLVLVRINALTNSHWRQDLASVVSKKLFGLLLPKCESLRELKNLERSVRLQEKAAGLAIGSIRFFLLIETARGLLETPRLAESSERISGLALGAEDFRLDMGTSRTCDGRELFFARSFLAVCARASACLAIDSVYGDFRDVDGLRRDTQLSKELGFSAKLAIHPQQVGTIHEVFAPTEQEIAEAKQVLEAFARAKAKNSGVAVSDGRMIDKPIVDRAQRLINGLPPKER
jgi:citrate lyase subunit beta/citryl-CoA lyase